MRKNVLQIVILFLFLLALPISVQAKDEVKPNDYVSPTPLEGFWGMKFGDSIASCKRVLAQKPDVTIDQKISTEKTIFINSCTFGGRKADFAGLSFVDDKLHTVSICFKLKLEAEVQEFYDNLKAEIDKKYYPAHQHRLFKSPYHDGDGDEMEAAKLGKANIIAYWKFARKDSKEYNLIVLKIDEGLHVVLTYQDGVLINNVYDKEKEKNAKDF